MNINKFQNPQQPNLQAQQILLQQLQQGQSQVPSTGINNQFNPENPDALKQGMFQNTYQRNIQSNPQVPVNGQQFFTQFLQQSQVQQQPQQQQVQPQLQYQLQLQLLQSQQLQLQQSQSQQFSQYQQNQQLPPHLSQGQTAQGPQFLSQQLTEAQKQPTSIQIDNPNSVHWQHQQQLCQISRSVSVPHYFARQYAANSRKAKNPYNEVKSMGLLDATKTIVASLEEQEKNSQKSTQTPAANAALLYNKKTSN